MTKRESLPQLRCSELEGIGGGTTSPTLQLQLAKQSITDAVSSLKNQHNNSFAQILPWVLAVRMMNG